MELEARQRPRHRAPFQMLALTGTTQHRRVSLLIITRAARRAKNRILRLLDLTFLANGTNLVLIGNPGVGKTFLSKIVGWRACQANQRVLFTTAMDMLNHLLASQVDHSLVRKLKTYTEPALLICDELGYLALDQQTSNLFYQVISTRHSQKRSTIITTNTAFSDWGNILFNTTIATAIADRLVENSEIFLFGGDSLRKPQESESASRVVCAGSDQAPRCGDIPAGGVRRVTPQRRCQGGGGFRLPLFRFSPPCSTSAPIICSCSRGRNTGRVRCSCCGTSTRSAFTGSMTSPKPCSSGPEWPTR